MSNIQYWYNFCGYNYPSPAIYDGIDIHVYFRPPELIDLLPLSQNITQDAKSIFQNYIKKIEH